MKEAIGYYVAGPAHVTGPLGGKCAHCGKEYGEGQTMAVQYIVFHSFFSALETHHTYFVCPECIREKKAVRINKDAPYINSESGYFITD